jgi:uncharacterized protein YndB with AHSA1/START domain
MQQEQMTSKITIDATPDAVFDVLVDPTTHAAIDGTGWVREPLDPARLTDAGQFFRMEMYHENHPDKIYEVANRVETIEPPHAIAWKPGTGSPETGEVGFGGWMWRYDLEAVGPSQTTVTLTYDWSAATPEAREVIQFPPFGVEHLERSLRHLSDLATRP